MAYQAQEWRNGDKETPLSASRLLHMEAGIDDAHKAVDSIPSPNDGQDGTDGKDGKSAYELAVDAGFEGGESEWLASLKGKDGKDGSDGQNGKDGNAAPKQFTDEEAAKLKELVAGEGE